MSQVQPLSIKQNQSFDIKAVLKVPAMSGELDECSDLDLIKFLSSLDKEQAILNGDAEWIVFWSRPTVPLVSRVSKPTQRLMDLAHSDEALLLTPDKVGNVERRLEKLVDLAYLTLEEQGVYRIEAKLVSGLVRLTRKDPEN